jgi:nucleoside-diphosphate-sugar epimerase
MNTDKRSILIVGGAGYIGVELAKDLIKKGFNVHCFDNLIYKQNKPKINKKKFKFIKGDICNKKDCENLFKIDYEAIIMLAGLVGDPITKKYSNISKNINDIGIMKLIKNFQKNKNFKKFIFISTCSNYGLVKKKNKIKENHQLAPLSLYAKSKVKIENFLMKKKKNFKPTILRFATAFGYSERMRYDLTINQFVLEMLFNKYIEVYDYDTWRPYCHIKDFARLIIKVINSKHSSTDYQVFNAGSDKNNFNKKKIAEKVKKYLGGKIKLTNASFDKRNYIVDFSKVERILGFKAKYSVDFGIKEIIKNIKKNKKKFNELKKLGNFILYYGKKKN